VASMPEAPPAAAGGGEASSCKGPHLYMAQQSMQGTGELEHLLHASRHMLQHLNA
jgi:hypothetical protein